MADSNETARFRELLTARRDSRDAVRNYLRTLNDRVSTINLSACELELLAANNARAAYMACGRLLDLGANPTNILPPGLRRIVQELRERIKGQMSRWGWPSPDLANEAFEEPLKRARERLLVELQTPMLQAALNWVECPCWIDEASSPLGKNAADQAFEAQRRGLSPQRDDTVEWKSEWLWRMERLQTTPCLAPRIHVVGDAERHWMVNDALPVLNDGEFERFLSERFETPHHFVDENPSPLPDTSDAGEPQPTEDAPLSQDQKDLLMALLEGGAADSDHLIPTPALCQRAKPPAIAAADNAKRAVSDLKKKGLVVTKTGRQGGVWLTALGKARAEKLARN